MKLISLSVIRGQLAQLIYAFVMFFAASMSNAQGLDSGSNVPPQQIRAQLTPVRQTVISSEMPGVINAINVKESDRFEEGQVLIELDCDMQNAQRDRAAAELASAEALEKANVRLNELDSVGRLDVELSEIGRQRAAAEVRMHEVAITKCTIQAPFSGRVADLLINAREYVQPGQPLVEVFDDTELELEFIVPSWWLRKLSVGQIFDVRIDETELTYQAAVKRIGARADPVSQTVRIAAEISGEQQSLIAGMSGSVFLDPQ